MQMTRRRRGAHDTHFIGSTVRDHTAKWTSSGSGRGALMSVALSPRMIFIAGGAVTLRDGLCNLEKGKCHESSPLNDEACCHFAAKAAEAIEVRLIAGAEYPQEATAGRQIGHKIAALAVARGKSDNSSAKWTGTVPEGTGLWKGTNPIAPAAGTWQPWVLAQASEGSDPSLLRLSTPSRSNRPSVS